MPTRSRIGSVMQPRPRLSSDPGDRNSNTWAGGRFVRHYATRELRPVEVLLLVRYRDDLSGTVLELGCGAGRLTGYLSELAETCYGMDLSDAMLRRARDRYPSAHFINGDFRDLAQLKDQTFDAIVAGCNVLDILSDQGRRETLREIRRVLRPGGLLVMSSHNRAYIPHVRGPLHLGARHSLRSIIGLALIPRNTLRHLRLRHLERHTADYEIISDGAHGFALVHYFIKPEAQARQLESEGFQPLECLDREGRRLAPNDSAAYEVELHYTARRL